jgi:diguanylate cyclase (GGDEF)-like protein
MYALPPELTRPGAAYADIVAYRMRNLGYRNLASVPQPRGDDLTREETMVKRELADGRTILVRSRPIAEGGWIASHEDVSERQAAEKRLSHMATHDALTGLPNRVLLQERLERAVAGLQDGARFAVMCVDLDHFKVTNDTLGHSVGDAVLREFGARLQASVRTGDTVARIGGDEFAIVQFTAGGPEEAAGLAQRLLAAMNEPYEFAGHKINVGASLGIACAPGDGDEGDLLLRRADIALYRAKAENRRGHCFFEAGMDTELESRRNLEIEFREALRQEQFEVFYQPLLDAKTRTIRSFEALVRWRHPRRGLVPPMEFVPLAEETGLIVPLGAWVLKTACREASRWPADIGVAVNLSALQFKAAGLVQNVRAALEGAKLDSRRLELEITESALLQENNRTLKILHELRAMGIKIAMDDFGTGYSSLSYLRSFPFDKIKIDKSFIQNLDQRDSRAIVRSIAALGVMMEVTTTAEGIETENQLEAVIEKGCIEVQGYMFSKPVPASEVDGLLDRYYRTPKAA